MKIHNILYVIVISLTIMACSKKVELKGRVQDENGKAVSGATILMGGSMKPALSDVLGEFSIIIPVSETILKINKVGYFPLVEKINSVEDQANTRTLIMNTLKKDMVYHETDSLMTEMLEYETVYKNNQFWGMLGSNVSIPFSVSTKMDDIQRFKSGHNQSFLSSIQIGIIKVEYSDHDDNFQLGSLSNYVAFRESKISFNGRYASKNISVQGFFRCELINPDPGFYAVTKMRGNMNASGQYENTYPDLFLNVYLFMVE
jgi:hypothetical protein